MRRRAARPNRRASPGSSSSSSRVCDQASGRGGPDQAAGLAVGDQVGVAADARDHAGQGGRHGLQERVAHAFREAREDEDVGGAEVVGRVVDGADELDPIGDAQRAGQLGERLAIAPRARSG